MRKFTNEIAYSALLGLMKVRKFILRFVINTRFGYLVVGVIIGMTSIIIFYEVSNNDYKFSIQKVVYQSEVAPQVGELVEAKAETGSLAKEPEQAVEPSNIEALITSYFTDRSETALAIAKCESSLNEKTIGDTHLAKPSIGLFQINQQWHPYSTEQLQDAKMNCKVAKEIYDSFEKRTGDGFLAWSCYKTNQYKKFL